MWEIEEKEEEKMTKKEKWKVGNHAFVVSFLSKKGNHAFNTLSDY